MTIPRPLSPINHHSPYVTAAIAGELRTLATLPDENPAKPHSMMFASFIRLAAVGKAAGFPPGAFVAHITAALAQSTGRPAALKQNELQRQWSNAWRMAVPRPGVQV